MKALLAIGMVSAFSLYGCAGGANYAPSSSYPAGDSPQTQSVTMQPNSATDTTSVLKALDLEHTVGSTVDPANHNVNPYGLDVAKVTAGKIDKGDLVVCNFNDAANVQGTGSSLIALHPQFASRPRTISDNEELTGCTALATAPNGNIWETSFSENDAPIFSPSGALITPLITLNHPFGETFAPRATPFGIASFYESNAGDGTIVRINITSHGFTFQTIARGFAVNHGAPGSILGPSGLQYDSARDRLFIVDGTNNTLTRFDDVSRIPAEGIRVIGTTFSGFDAHLAHTIFQGPPLNGPISSALLPGGHIVLGNTSDPDGHNLFVEFNQDGKLLDVKNVDNGPAGALFGMVATGTTFMDTKLYFNDDNDNTVKVLLP